MAKNRNGNGNMAWPAIVLPVVAAGAAAAWLLTRDEAQRDRVVGKVSRMIGVDDSSSRSTSGRSAGRSSARTSRSTRTSTRARGGRGSARGRGASRTRSSRGSSSTSSSD